MQGGFLATSDARNRRRCARSTGLPNAATQTNHYVTGLGNHTYSTSDPFLLVKTKKKPLSSRQFSTPVRPLSLNFHLHDHCPEKSPRDAVPASRGLEPQLPSLLSELRIVPPFQALTHPHAFLNDADPLGSLTLVRQAPHFMPLSISPPLVLSPGGLALS